MRLYFKRFVKGIARKYELAASFMAKPFLDRAGNGFHVHFSLLDREGGTSSTTARPTARR